MKLKVVLFLFFSIASFLELNAQTVAICVTINGTAMPASKTWSMCKKNVLTADNVSSVQLVASNCAASPQTDITVKWKNLSVPPNTEILNDTIVTFEAGTWEVTITDNVTLTDYTETLTISYYPISVAITEPPYNPSTQGCPLYSYTLTTTTTGTISGYQWYTYNPKTVVTGATASSYSIYQRNKYYIVDVTDANNCRASDTTATYFLGLTAPIVDLGPDPTGTFCEGQTFNLQSLVHDGITNPTYPDPSGVIWGIDNTPLDTIIASQTNPPAPVSLVLTAGTHDLWLIIKHFPYCDNIDRIRVTANPIPVVSLPLGPLDTCYAANTNLTATVSLGTAPFNYVWSSAPASAIPATNNSSSNTNTVTVVPTANTVYTVTVSDSYNCSSGSDNITVNVNPEIITTASPDIMVCRYPTDSTTLTASATGGIGAKTYQWSPPNGLSTTTSGTINAFPNTTTTYTVTSTDAVGCTDTEDVLVTSYTPPVNTNQEPQVINEDISTRLEASINAALPSAGNNGAFFEWTTSINNIPFSNSSNIYLEYAGPDTVWYVVKVTNPTPVNGSGLQCYVTDTIEIRSISNNTLMYVPNVFSPNAINSTNQTIKIYSTNILPDGFKWLIFNKWGNLMYETTNLDEAQYKGWDGGSMIEGVYSYVIVGTFKNGKDLKESEAYKGTFTLIK